MYTILEIESITRCVIDVINEIIFTKMILSYQRSSHGVIIIVMYAD